MEMGGGLDDGMIDDSIESIVWVRKRNGSWWPGGILAADELSLSNLMSSRSRMPINLLGREDASVDWYNLKKSSDSLNAKNYGLSGQNAIGDFGSRQFSFQEVRQRNEINREVDGTEGMPRMRGLQDFGLRIAHAKKRPVIAMVYDVMENFSLLRTVLVVFLILLVPRRMRAL